MFTAKKRKPVRLLCQLTAMILALLLLVSCGGRNPSGGDRTDSEGKPEVTKKVEDPGSSTVGESFNAYIEAKGELISVLSDALASNPDTALDSMSFLGVAMLDIALIPATCFGLEQDVVTATLGILGINDVEYSESGNQYSIKYLDNEGKQNELRGEYDKAADALKCISKTDGKENLISEYRKTSFGYVGQFYAVNEDGSTYLYQLAVSGKDGAIGISQASSEPPALTGSETIDFPKQCAEWYAIKGNALTGVTSAGREISFTYTPSGN